jgi:class 3 adenylate cyclase
VSDTAGPNDVAAFLARLGLGRYAAAFAANDIDWAVLPRLTAQDLRDIGVASVGHVRRILDAIAALQDPSALAKAPLDPGQRRHLTVMFSDIVGSSALAERLDPEDAREVIRRYQDTCTRVARRYGGTVARFVGDGVLYYFGYPQAQEDHAARAVRCALELVRAIAGLAQPHGEPIQVRVGIASGLVVVGDIVGEESRETDAIVGETPNLAARLQALAGPGGVVVAESTRRLCAGAIEFSPAGSHLFKGARQSVAAFHALKPTESGWLAPHASDNPIVGRDIDLTRLEQYRKLASAGVAQAVRIVGEPGMGKSTLAAMLVGRAVAHGAWVCRLQCSPYHQDSPLYPMIDALQRVAGIRPEDAPEDKWRKLCASLGAPHRVRGSAAALAPLLDIPVPSRADAPARAGAHQRRDRVFRVLCGHMLSLARKRETLLLVEDLHWCDRSTLDLIEFLLPALRSARVLLIATHRPEFSWDWPGDESAHVLELGRLGHEASMTLLIRRLGERAVPQAVLAELADRCDGVPLFIEELAKSVLEAPASQGSQGAGADARAIPESLHGLLTARLDRLGEAKELAQIAATIGRAFPQALLAAIWEHGTQRLDAALAALLESGILVRQGQGAHAEYRFHHALTRDAAYEMLLKSRRRTLHARVAECVQRITPQAVAANPEILARHYAEAGMQREAFPLWRVAGQRATRRWADVEAAAHYRAALAALRECGDGAVDDDTMFDTLLEAVRPMVAAAGYNAPEVLATVEWAAAIGARFAEPKRLFPILFHQWIGLIATGEVNAAHALGERFGQIAESVGGEIERLLLLRMNGTTRMFRGELLLAREPLLQFVSHFDAGRHAAELRGYGTTEHQVTVSCSLAAIAALEGDTALAIRWRQHACELARDVGHAHSVAHALAFASCLTGALLGQVRHLRETASELIALAGEAGLPYWRDMGVYFLGCAKLMGDQDRAGLDEARAVVARLTASGTRVLISTLQVILASAAAAVDPAAAGVLLDAAGEIPGRERWLEAERLRVRAELLRARGEAESSRAIAAQALALAQTQGAGLLAARARALLGELAQTGEPI